MLYQAGFDVTFLDIFVIIYHMILYLILGIDRKTNINHIFVSICNIILLRYMIVKTLSILYFNITYVIDITVITQILFYYIVQEFYMYWAHRCLHKIKLLYNNIHYRHHILRAECFSTSFYMSPLEIIINIYPNLLLGPFLYYYWYGFLLKESLFIWTCLATFYFVWSHTNAHYTFMPSTLFHWQHHKYYTCNYGSWMTDKLFGTIYNQV